MRGSTFGGFLCELALENIVAVAPDARGEPQPKGTGSVASRIYCERNFNVFFAGHSLHISIFATMNVGLFGRQSLYYHIVSGSLARTDCGLNLKSICQCLIWLLDSRGKRSSV